MQVNPNFVYAHTLCGHEYQSNEDFEKAVSCYRKYVQSTRDIDSKSIYLQLNESSVN